MTTSFLPSRMRALRLRAHLKQEEIADYLNIERQTYSNYENALRTPPLEVVVLLADFYHISTDYLLREEASMPSSVQPMIPALSSEEKNFIASFRTLSAQNQQEVLSFIQFKHFTAASKSPALPAVSKGKHAPGNHAGGTRN